MKSKIYILFITALSCFSLIEKNNYVRTIQDCIDTVLYIEKETLKGKICDGKREGEWSFYYETGKIHSIYTFVNDTLNGKYESWHPNGKPLGIGIFKNGLLEGICYSYKETGFIECKASMKNGVEHGEFLSYDEQGDLKIKGNFKNGLKDGKFYSYLKGELIATAVFKDGTLIQHKDFK